MDGEDVLTAVDRLLGQTYWVIDLLPEQVSAEGAARFFAAEEWLLSGERGRDLRRRFADVLVKLGCYFDFVVLRDDDERGVRNPAPERLAAWVLEDRGTLSVVLPEADALIVVTGESTCMTLYHHTPELLELVRRLATADGLFVWQPGE